MKLAFLMLALASFVVARAEVIGKTVKYTAGGVALKGYLAYDSSVKGKRPAVIVVHEWWGVTDYPKKRADMLAKLGYVAFAADMYGNGKIADNPTDAQKYAGESMKDFSSLKEKFTAVIDLLKKNELVDPNNIAAIGYCYGGGVVLNMARAGVDLKVVVSFHGNLTAVKPAQSGKVKAKILVFNGGADKLISDESISNFKKEMNSAGVDFIFKSYRGALHAFSNPAATELGKKFNMPIAYNEKADKKSWAEMQKFLKTALK
ncbi:MAG: dienelactone hydrolase family protein [Bacteroidota bacterium]